MTETFQCASCSGPLDFEGTPMRKCKFCGCTVIVPSEMFHHQAFDASGGKIGAFAATQAYGIAFDNEGSLFIASRPFVVKYAVTL